VYNPRRNAGNQVTIGRGDASLIGIPNVCAAVDNAETKVDNDVPSRAAVCFELAVTIIIEVPPFSHPFSRLPCLVSFSIEENPRNLDSAESPSRGVLDSAKIHENEQACECDLIFLSYRDSYRYSHIVPYRLSIRSRKEEKAGRRRQDKKDSA